jgi:hypothetical protein
MPGSVSPWNSKEWEKHVQLLLKRRYAHPPGSYQHVPDTVHGDYGVEGFGSDGTAYQCYAAQDWVSAEDLVGKQKNKVTSDIGKFIRNESSLVRLFGAVKISIWNFVVPYWSNKELVEHASKKAAEVGKLSLTHVATSFRISILTEEDFAVEKQLLANLDLHKFNAVTPSIDPTKLSAWMDRKKNLQLVANLRRKAQILIRAKSEQLRERFEVRTVANYIGGNVVLGRLEQELPETYSTVMALKSTREANLESESALTHRVPSEFFEKTLEEYRELMADIPGIGLSAADTLAREAVSDWLLRCPLDFPDAE